MSSFGWLQDVKHGNSYETLSACINKDYYDIFDTDDGDGDDDDDDDDDE